MEDWLDGKVVAGQSCLRVTLEIMRESWKGVVGIILAKSRRRVTLPDHCGLRRS